MSSNYRVVAYRSEVDESLFSGGKRAGSAEKPASSRSGVLRLSGQKSLGALDSAAVVLTPSELARIKSSAVIKTAEDLRREAAEAEAENAARVMNAKERKERILALEEQRKKTIPLTPLEQEKQQENAKILQRASFLSDEARDDVKTMNSFSEYAKTVTIRNLQITEKKEREVKEREAERIRDLEMEVQRLEQIKLYRDRESAQREALTKARSHIEVQIVDREKAREVERQKLLAEQVAAKEEMRRAEERAREEAQRVAERRAAERAAVLRANEAALDIKRRRKEEDEEENRKIAAYIAAEEEKKRLAEIAEEERQAAKDAEFAKLRAAQEKVADGRAALDALRARRAFEAGQREAREREAEAARKRRDMIEEEKRLREEQKQAKELLVALEIQKERDEFERNQRVRNEWVAKERAEAEALRERNMAHRVQLAASIDDRADARRKEREVYLTEGMKQRDRLEGDLEAVRSIRERKVAELLSAGVDPLYTVELKSFDPQTRVSQDYKLGASHVKSQPSAK